MSKLRLSTSILRGATLCLRHCRILRYPPVGLVLSMSTSTSTPILRSYVTETFTREEQSGTGMGGGPDKNKTLDGEEVKKFERMASSWWDPNGAMKELHSMNRLRVPLIRDGLLEGSGKRTGSLLGSPKPLENLDVLDVGSGGGILAEPLGRLGASVLGLDPGQENVTIAEMHLSQNHPELKDRVQYKCETIEEFVTQNPGRMFDGVVSSETIEHVENPEAFLSMMGQCVKPNGSLFLTTLNRTFESWAGAIVAWEYILRRLPVGTHNWNKFLTPQEIQRMLNNNGFVTKLVHGMCYNPVTNQWTWSKSTSINYCIHAVRES